MEEITISAYNVVGNAFCVEADDGQRLFDLIKKGLNEEKRIILSFKNVEMLTSAFLNTAIGQLYRDYEEEIIKQHLTTQYLSDDDKVLLKRVISTAKIYYKNPERMQESISEILGE